MAASPFDGINRDCVPANLFVVPILHPSPKHCVYVGPRIVRATTAVRLDLFDAVQQYMEDWSLQTSAIGTTVIGTTLGTLALGNMDLRRKIVDHLFGG